MQTIPRVGALAWRLSLVLLVCAGASSPARLGAADKLLLAPGPKAVAFQRVKAVFEAQGELKLNPDGKKVTRKPMEVKGEFLYDQRLLDDPQEATPRLVRHYQQAQALMKVDQSEHEAQLGEQRRIIVLQADPQDPLLFSPLGPLTREELELIDIHAGRLTLDVLLPDSEVEIGQDWSISPQVLARLLNLDVVSQAEVNSTLRSVDNDKAVALIEMAGSGSGAVGGVASDFQVQAKYNFDLQSKHVTWLAMSVKENRAIGHAEPGYEAVLRLRMATSPLDQADALSDDALEGLILRTDDGVALVSYHGPDQRFQMLHDRRWRVLTERHDVTILRMVDRGDLIAQCNVSELAELPEGRQLTLEAFQAEIRRALGENFGQFVEASQSSTTQGLTVLRVVASGVVSELPIQWCYYHVANQQGRRVSFVFTLESKLAERFAAADTVLVSSLELLTAAEPQPVSTPADDQ